MPLNIPMPSLNRNGLFEGLLYGNQRKQAQQQLAQQWQQHLNNMEMRQAQQEIQKKQQARLDEQFEMEKQLHPYAIQAAKQAQQLNPAKYELLKAQIEAQQALAEQRKSPPISNYKPSELERIANLLSGGDQEVQNQLLAEGAATKYGLTLPGSENLPLGSVPFKSLPKNLQAQENADQIKMQSRVNDAIKANHNLTEMEKIIKENPDMAREFAYILGNPEDKSFRANLFRRFMNKQKLAEIEKFSKYANDFVLSAGSGLGNNFTDAKLKALQLSKMHPGNTDEANQAIINNYKERLKPLINYGSALKKARGKYTLPYFEESYTDEALGLLPTENKKIRPIQSLTDEELEALGEGY